jgi:Protein of unknown function (DUF2752)
VKKLNSDLVIAISCTGILLASAVCNVASGSVNLAGVALPPVCAFKLLTSWDCPGCGLTRSLVLAIHGHFRESYFMHLWGIPMLLILISHVPYRVFRYLRPQWKPPFLPAQFKEWFSPAVFLSFLLPWAAKTIALFVVRYL